MKIRYDRKVDALSIRFNNKRYAESDEVSEGIIFDYDRDGNIIGMEILNASKILSSQARRRIAGARQLYATDRRLVMSR